MTLLSKLKLQQYNPAVLCVPTIQYQVVPFRFPLTLFSAKTQYNSTSRVRGLFQKDDIFNAAWICKALPSIARLCTLATQKDRELLVIMHCSVCTYLTQLPGIVNFH